MVSRTLTQILDFLDRHPSTSADQISQSLSVTKENIQYHLIKLLQNGTVQRTNSFGSKNTQRGRPTYLYRLSEQSRQGNISDLADKLLIAMLKTNPSLDSQSEQLFQLACSMFPVQPSSTQTQKLRQIIQRLNQHHYQAAWEARASGPYVSFRNCPYASILKNHPELCQLDTYILTSMLNGCVTQITKMDLESRKPPACTFLLQPNSFIGKAIKS